MREKVQPAMLAIMAAAFLATSPARAEYLYIGDLDASAIYGVDPNDPDRQLHIISATTTLDARMAVPLDEHRTVAVVDRSSDIWLHDASQQTFIKVIDPQGEIIALGPGEGRNEIVYACKESDGASSVTLTLHRATLGSVQVVRREGSVTVAGFDADVHADATSLSASTMALAVEVFGTEGSRIVLVHGSHDDTSSDGSAALLDAGIATGSPAPGVDIVRDAAGTFFVRPIGGSPVAMPNVYTAGGDPSGFGATPPDLVLTAPGAGRIKSEPSRLVVFDSTGIRSQDLATGEVTQVLSNDGTAPGNASRDGSDLLPSLSTAGLGWNSYAWVRSAIMGFDEEGQRLQPRFVHLRGEGPALDGIAAMGTLRDGTLVVLLAPEYGSEILLVNPATGDRRSIYKGTDYFYPHVEIGADDSINGLLFPKENTTAGTRLVRFVRMDPSGIWEPVEVNQQPLPMDFFDADLLDNDRLLLLQPFRDGNHLMVFGSSGLTNLYPASFSGRITSEEPTTWSGGPANGLPALRFTGQFDIPAGTTLTAGFLRTRMTFPGITARDYRLTLFDATGQPRIVEEGTNASSNGATAEGFFGVYTPFTPFVVEGPVDFTVLARGSLLTAEDAGPLRLDISPIPRARYVKAIADDNLLIYSIVPPQFIRFNPQDLTIEEKALIFPFDDPPTPDFNGPAAFVFNNGGTMAYILQDQVGLKVRQINTATGLVRSLVNGRPAEVDVFMHGNLGFRGALATSDFGPDGVSTSGWVMR